MKKVLYLMIFVFSILLVGCDFLTTTSTITTTTLSATTTSTSSTTTSSMSTVTTTQSSTTTTTQPTTTTTTQPTTTTTTQPTTTTTTSTTVPPVITISLNPGQDTVEINSNWINAGATLKVNSTEFAATTTDTVDLTTLGIYEVDYVFVYNEVMYSITRYVIVVDQTAPVISLNLGIDTILKGGVWSNAGAYVTDNSLESISITVSGSVNTAVSGSYQIVYTAQDSSGNSSSIIRFVTVVD